MKKPTIAIIGAGNMGASILGGLIADHYPPENIRLSDPDTAKLNILQQKFNVLTTHTNQQAIQAADVIILSVKPQLISDVTQEIQKTIQKNKPLIISVAAGVRVARLQTELGGSVAIVRVMPNTPALIGAGASVLYANSFVKPQQHELAESILRSVGLTLWLTDENLLDVVTAISGSGPAYFFLIIETLQAIAIECGLPEEAASLLTAQTALGAARMALETKSSVEELRHNVTSPGGTTAAALTVLEEKNIRGIFHDAIRAAIQRAKELAE